jgi:hypothetical protein
MYTLHFPIANGMSIFALLALFISSTLHPLLPHNTEGNSSYPGECSSVTVNALTFHRVPLFTFTL